MPPVLPLMKKPARLCLAAGTLFTLFLTPLAQGRTWTNLQGKKLEAEFIRLDGQKAVLKRSGGQTVSIPLTQLSREDRDFIAEQEKGGALPSNTADNYHLPWPRSVKCPDNFKVETIKEEPGEYIYETPHFRFICDAKLGTGMIKRLGLLFEATHLANKTLPIGNSLPMTIPPNSPPTCMKNSAPIWKTADAKARRASSWGQRGQGTAEEFWFRSIPWESKPWEAHTSLTVTRTLPPSSMN